MIEDTENFNQFTLEKLIKDIANKNKRQDFLQVCGTLKPADKLLLSMYEQVATRRPTSAALHQLFVWVHQKAFSVEGGHNSIPVHTFYFALIRVLYLTVNRIFDSSQGLTGTRFREFVKNLDKAYSFTSSRSGILTLNSSMGENPIYIISCVFADYLEPELKEFLLSTRSQLVPLQSNVEEFKHWRLINGKNYINTFRNILGFHVNFSDSEKELLKDYYYVYDLLLFCLNNENCQVTEPVKNQIDSNILFLFMPSDNGATTT